MGLFEMHKAKTKAGNVAGSAWESPDAFVKIM